MLVLSACLKRPLYQCLRLQVLDDGVLPYRQMVLVAAENQAMVYGVPNQVDARAHDEHDDADVHHGAWQGLRGALDELKAQRW